MDTDKRKRIRLEGALEKTASSVEIRPDGGLLVEFHDFSPDAHASFGNDIAYLLKLTPAARREVLMKLVEGGAAHAGDESDDLLLRLIGDRFVDYFAFKDWLDENRVAYEPEFDRWA